MGMEYAEAAVQRLQHFANYGVGYDVSKDIRTLIDYIADLKEEIEDLRIEARESRAWGRHYWAILEEVEAARRGTSTSDSTQPPTT